jgi:hypothetical protein
MFSGQSNYASYLLRLVKADRDGHAWRASLESTADGERLEFGSVAALTAFLQERYGQTDEVASPAHAADLPAPPCSMPCPKA